MRAQNELKRAFPAAPSSWTRVDHMGPVLTKQDFYRRFLQDEFGNRGPIWFDYESWARECYATARELDAEARYMIRSMKPGGFNQADLMAHEVVAHWYAHSGKEPLSISLMCPHHRQTINGELQADHRGLCLYYSHVKKPMRPSLAEGGRQVYGAAAAAVLQQEVWPADRDWLMELLDRYPGHVVEFTAFRVYWGIHPRSKCSIWEVRAY